MTMISDVLRTLRANPAGMTTAEVAKHLSITPGSASGVLSRLHAYGRLDREIVRNPDPPRNLPPRWSVWRLKQENAHRV